MTDMMITQGAPRGILAYLRAGGPTRRWGAKRVTALALAVLLALTGLLGGLGATAAHAADPDEDTSKYSLYKVGAAMVSLFSTVQEPGYDRGFNPAWTSVLADPGSAGSLLGYADANLFDADFLKSQISGSSDAVGYSTLMVQDEDGNASASNEELSGALNYAYFGATLNGLGLDSTSTGFNSNMMNYFSGGLMLLLFSAAGGIDTMFNAAIQGLAMLNPFKLFYAAIQGLDDATSGGFYAEAADGMVGGAENADVGPLSGVVSFIDGWFGVLNQLAWQVMVPIFIALLVVGLLLYKKMDRGGAIKKLIVRVAFIGLGVPLMGSMYTGMINGMADASIDGNNGAIRVVASTYVDFENWVKNSRLRIPDGSVIAWDRQTAQPTAASMAKVRETTLAINDQNLYLGVSGIEDLDGSWSDSVLNEADGGTISSTAHEKVAGMLTRYMDGAQISSADFETSAQGTLIASSEDGGTIESWFSKLVKDSGELNKDGSTEAYNANPVITVESGKGLRVDTNGSTHTFSSEVSSCQTRGLSATPDGVYVVKSGAKPRACNLAPMAMYNYLNTEFGQASMTAYSPKNASSGGVRSLHNSVNLVGTGAMSLLYWFNAVTLLGAFVVIGFTYALALIFGSIRRSLQIIMSVPFATIGALAAIAKVIVYAVALTLMVIVTIFIYEVVQMFLISLPQIIEMPFAQLLRGLEGSGELTEAQDFMMKGSGLLTSFLSIIGVIVFTVMALRVRKTFVKAMEEAVTKIIERFMQTQVGMPSSGGMAPAMAGGLASGAGAAAANRMMNKSGGKGAVAANKPAADGKGPNAVTTAGGTTAAGAGADGAPGQDGQLELTGEMSGADGNGDPGSPQGGLPPSDANRDAAAEEVGLGRQVEVDGLSKPGELTAGGAAGETRAPQVGDDALSGASDSIDSSVAGYAAADQKRLEVGKEGAQAVGHAGLAVGHGLAGDGAGAAAEGGKALEHGGAAAASGHQAKQVEADAGRSSLDAPDTEHAQAAAKAQQVSAAGSAVAGVAGIAGGASGGGATKEPAGPAPSAPKDGAKGTPGPTAPRNGGGRGRSAARPSSQQPSSGGRGDAGPKTARPAPKSTASRPAPQPAKQAPQPAKQAPQPAQSAPRSQASKPAPRPTKAPAPRPAKQTPQPAKQVPRPAGGGAAPKQAPRPAQSAPRSQASKPAPRPTKAPAPRPAQPTPRPPRQQAAPAPKPTRAQAPRAPKPVPQPKAAPAPAPTPKPRRVERAPRPSNPRDVKAAREGDRK